MCIAMTLIILGQFALRYVMHENAFHPIRVSPPYRLSNKTERDYYF